MNDLYFTKPINYRCLNLLLVFEWKDVNDGWENDPIAVPISSKIVINNPIAE